MPLGPNQETPCSDSNRERNRWEQRECGKINNGDRSTGGGSADYRGADLGSRQTRVGAMVGNPPSEAPGVGAGGETPHSARWPWDVLWSHLKWSRTLESRREAPSSRDPFPHPLRTQLNITLAAKEKCLHGQAPRPQNRSWSVDSELGDNKLIISPKKKIPKKTKVGLAKKFIRILPLDSMENSNFLANPICIVLSPSDSECFFIQLHSSQLFLYPEMSKVSF